MSHAMANHIVDLSDDCSDIGILFCLEWAYLTGIAFQTTEVVGLNPTIIRSSICHTQT